ncbi:MAG TPA: hypothetical protein VF591_11350 [Pyrinomonadaceae bacterium]
MEFIVEQQAKFAAKIGQLEDNLARMNRVVEQQGENVQRLGENVERLVGVIERVADTVAQLAQVTAERFEAVEKHGDETDRKIAALVDAQIRTEEESLKLKETMRTLASTVERHLADGHGGRARP